MSSATPSNPDAARKMVYSDAISASMNETKTLAGGLSARQMLLNRLWSFYACQHYEGRKVDWDGKENLEHLESEVVAQSGVLPPGFMDSGQTLPLKFRKPTAPYHICRVIVNRFTGLLFGKKRAPKIHVLDDKDTDDWINAFITETRLWSRMILARTYGGAMGSVAVGFKFVNGMPIVEVHDPRWSFVDFEDVETGTLRVYEKRYLYPKEIKNPDTGEWVTASFWYRRVIDKQFDRVWPAVPAEKDQEPDWNDPAYRMYEVEHGFGFVPVIWIQNHEVQDSEDGWTDCDGIYEMSETIDALISQANRGTLANCDPTTVITSDSDGFSEGIRKGSQNALWLEKGGSANYMELSGAGAQAAITLAKELRTLALEVAQCVLDTNFQGPARTEEEVMQNYSAMLETADKLREQYGVGIYRLCKMVLLAARKLETPVSAQVGTNVRVISRAIKLPPRIDSDPDGENIMVKERMLGKGTTVNLTWPGYGEPSLADAGQAVVGASQAKLTGLIDLDTAIKHIAPYFQIENIAKVKKAAEAEAKKESSDVMQRIMSQAGAGVMSGKTKL
jgi:hypothetical protein